MGKKRKRGFCSLPNKTLIWIFVFLFSISFVLGANELNYDGEEAGTSDNNATAVYNSQARAVYHFGINGSAEDSTTNNNDGSLTGPPDFTNNCAFGNCYTFDGVNDYITINDSVSMNISSGEMTVLGFANPDDFGDWAVIIARWTNPYNYYLGIESSSGDTFFQIRESDGTYVQATGAPSAITGSWNLILGEADNTSNLARVWSNVTGSWAVDDTTPWDNTFQSAGMQIQIGQNPGGISQEFDGLLDEIRLYGILLSNATKQEFYDNSQGLNMILGANNSASTDCAGYSWEFDVNNLTTSDLAVSINGSNGLGLNKTHIWVNPSQMTLPYMKVCMNDSYVYKVIEYDLTILNVTILNTSFITDDTTPDIYFNVFGGNATYDCTLYNTTTKYGTNGSVLNNTNTFITFNTTLTQGTNYTGVYINCSINATTDESSAIIWVQIAPPFNISIINPTDDTTYDDETFFLNITNTSGVISTSWYSLNGGVNITFINPINININDSIINANLTVYANDSFGRIAQDSVQIHIINLASIGGGDMTQALSITLFLGVLTFIIFYLSIKYRFVKDEWLNFCISKSLFVFGLFLLSFDTVIIRAFAIDGGFGIESNIFTIFWIIQYTSYIALAVLLPYTLVKAVKMFRTEKDNKRIE